VQLDVPVRVEGREVVTQPGSAGFLNAIFDWQGDTLEVAGRSSGKKDLDRPYHPPAAEVRLIPPAQEERLVDVMVQNDAEALTVEPAQGEARGFSERVANAVRMPGPLALDDLHCCRGNRQDPNAQALVDFD
jgi:hypothetical protein